MEYLKLLYTEGVIIETTAGHKSTSNAKVESAVRVNYQLTRIALAMSGLPVNLWCFVR